MAVEPPPASGELHRLIVATPQKFAEVKSGFQYGCGISEDGIVR